MADMNEKPVDNKPTGNQVGVKFSKEDPLKSTTGHLQPPVGCDSPSPVDAIKEDSTGTDGKPSKETTSTKQQHVSHHESRKLKVGDRYVVNYPRKAPVSLAIIKVLTNEPGRHVGVEFDTKIGEYADNGNCNNKCKPGQGLWVHPSHLITEDEHKAMVARGESDSVRIVEEMQELEFDPITGAIK